MSEKLYKAINEWYSNFAKKHGRFPTVKEFREKIKELENRA